MSIEYSCFIYVHILNTLYMYILYMIAIQLLRIEPLNSSQILLNTEVRLAHFKLSINSISFLTDD